jgi:hypothetical protein
MRADTAALYQVDSMEAMTPPLSSSTLHIGQPPLER